MCRMGRGGRKGNKRGKVFRQIYCFFIQQSITSRAFIYFFSYIIGMCIAQVVGSLCFTQSQ